MGFLKGLWQWLTTPPGAEAGLKSPDDDPIVTEKLLEKYEVAEMAKKLALAGQPEPHATVRTGIEEKMIEEVNKKRLDYMSWAQSRLRVLNPKIHDTNVIAGIEQISADVTRFQSEIDARMNADQTELMKLAVVVESQRQEYEEFRQNNRLRREPRYQRGTKKFISYLGLLAMVIVEGALNAAFFAQGLDSGLIGGFTWAALASLVNIFVAATLAPFALQQLCHVSIPRRFAGVLLFCAYVAVAIAVAFGVSHFRDALSHGAENAWATALLTLKGNVIGLADLQSWMLFGLTLLFAALAVADRFYMLDPYPGYAAVHQRFAAAVEHYEELLDELREDLTRIKDEYLTRLQRGAVGLRTELNILNQAIEDKVNTGRKLEIGLDNADYCVTTVLNTFRDYNKLHRPEGLAAPQYFSDLYELRRMEIPDFDVSDARAKYSNQLKALEQFEKQIPELIERITRQFNTRYDGMRPLGDHFSASDGLEAA
jgi:hypothetical protein